jgi:hypothetical protein
MNLEDKVRILSTLTTRNSAGRHFMSLVPDDDLASLESDGLIVIHRPVDEATGIPYSVEHYSVEVTALGAGLVDVNPEYREEK